MSKKTPETIGTMMDDCVYLGRILIKNKQFAIMQPPKAIAERAPEPWNDSYAMVKGALSYCDGLSNTRAMAKAGSKLAQWALDNGLYLPSIDEQDLQYRTLKPGTEENSCYARSGINLNSVPQGQPYTPTSVKQTKLKPFREGGPEAFEKTFYWSSTQLVSNSYDAWGQGFFYGSQGYYFKGTQDRARAVRRIAI